MPNVTKKTILFIHGGGMFMEAGFFHWRAASKLIKRLGVSLWMPAYPLVPDTSFRDAAEMLLSVYEKMLEEYLPEDICFLGDSAGATLALVMCHHINTLRNLIPMPKKLVLLSPGAMTNIDPETLNEMKRISLHDPMLSTGFTDAISSIMGLNPDPGNYFDNPFDGDFIGFPPMYIFSGTYDILYAQIPKLIKNIESAEIPVVLYTGEKMMHIWPYMPFSRECRTAFNCIVEILS
jgi:acetyl esterase/lipase